MFGASETLADTSTTAEIALLKAQLRRLEAKVTAQEQQHREEKRATRQAPALQGPGTQVVTKGPLPLLAAAVCPPNKLCYKGITFTPGGFLALESVFRSRNMAADVDTPYGAIPFRQNRASRTSEFRFSARQSRVSGLVEGNVDPATHLSAYGEFDFLGAAQTANSNESNSYTPRVRHLYATVDQSDLGVHVLAGQTWSLATMLAKGLEVRKENIPLTIDAQYVPGFVWARQPQVRVTKDFANNVSAGVSVENPQTTESGTLPANFTYNQAATGGGLFNSANSLSLNHVPDVVGKVAWDPTVAGRAIHVEGFGIGRDFYSRENGHNADVVSGGGGGSVLIPVLPKTLDVQFSGAVGAGLGRYGTSQLPDITVNSGGTVKPIPETLLLAGATFHALPQLDIYAYAGMEEDSRRSFGTVGGVNYGYGNPANSNAGCGIEGSTLTCTGNTRSVRQATIGAWDTIYNGNYGQLRAGAQYSYTQRTGFSATVGGAPKTDENVVLTSLRYYPF